MSFDNLPLGWKLVPLEDAMDAIIDYRGKTPKKTESGIPLITAKIVKGGYILEPFEFIAEDNYDSWMVRGVPQVGDVVLTTEAPLGETAQLTSANVALAQRIVTLRGKNGLLGNDFLLCALQSKFVQHQLESRASGSTVKGIKQSELRKVILPVPPLPEQQKISQALKSLSNKLVCNTQTNQTLEQMAQAIFKSWFVDFDPVKAKMNGELPEGMDTATASLFPEKLVESELGLIPEGWDACLIENVTSKVFSGGTPATKNDEFWGGDLPWFSSGETRNNFIIETEKYITEAGVKGSSTKASAYGDILIASAGQGHTRGQTSFNSIDCYINQSVVALRAASNVSAYWLYYCLEHRYDEMRSVSDSHSSRGSLTTKLLKGMPAIRPSKDIINAFDRLVEPLVRKQITNSNQNRELSALRDTLLPKLLSGEIDLGDTNPESIKEDV
uniref:Type I restriction-modification system, specificity subunit S n=1 Tax=Aliivibrio fischeri TaxID=668 RepID=H2ERP8_ALIFS|nr:restriction endonuclease subunit S [Aliivibrio fischeri]AEY78065.1 Type I restriction-modification system, specificity subunit S [Aliivibrio fischeri]